MHYARTKHIKINVHFIQNLVVENKLEVRYVSSNHQPTDLFTKPLPLERFNFLCSKLSPSSRPISLRELIRDTSRSYNKDSTSVSHGIKAPQTEVFTMQLKDAPTTDKQTVQHLLK